jgi:ribosomal protein L30E
MKIDFAKLTYQCSLYKDEIDESIQKVLNHGRYIMGRK